MSETLEALREWRNKWCIALPVEALLEFDALIVSTEPHLIPDEVALPKHWPDEPASTPDSVPTFVCPLCKK